MASANIRVAHEMDGEGNLFGLEDRLEYGWRVEPLRGSNPWSSADARLEARDGRLEAGGWRREAQRFEWFGCKQKCTETHPKKRIQCTYQVQKH